MTSMRSRFVLLTVLVSLLAPTLARAQKLVFVVRHAERADDAMRDEADPPLSAAGQARAEKLAAMLADAQIKAIYVTAYRRTQQTAAPLATRLKLKVQPIPASAPALVSQLKTEHANDVVLIVAHSSTIDAILKALGGPPVRIDEREYNNLFILVPSTGAFSRVRY
jgi:broad specificity phosphatase PhoE